MRAGHLMILGAVATTAVLAWANRYVHISNSVWLLVFSAQTWIGVIGLGMAWSCPGKKDRRGGRGGRGGEGRRERERGSGGGLQGANAGFARWLVFYVALMALMVAFEIVCMFHIAASEHVLDMFSLFLVPFVFFFVIAERGDQRDKK